MAKQILLYGEIFDFSSEMFLTEMEALKDDEIVLRVNTIGGDPESAFGMISKFQDHEGLKTIKVDGRAFSMGAFFLCYVDFSECLDVSSFLLHRAAFPSWVEASETLFDDDTRGRLANINKSLRAALEAKIDVAKFEKISGVSMDQLFSMDDRVDVTLTAKEAKQIKLVNKINQITPEIQASIQSNSGKMMQIAAKYIDTPQATEEIVEVNKSENKNTNMDLAKFKSEHPGLYAQALEVGKKAGVAEEKDRAGAWMAFADIDPKAVAEGVKSGASLSATDMAEFTVKGISAKLVEQAEADSAENVETPKTEDIETPKATKKVNSFEASVKEKLRLKAD